MACRRSQQNVSVYNEEKSKFHKIKYFQIFETSVVTQKYEAAHNQRCFTVMSQSLYSISTTGARLDARTYTFAHPIWRTINSARKQGAISPILPVFCRHYLCDAIMLIKLSTVWPWVTGITTLEVAIVIANFARDARMNTVNVCRMRERIKQDARTSLLMRERTHIVRGGSFN